MARYKYDVPMPETYSALLKRLVTESIENKSLTGNFKILSSNETKITYGPNKNYNVPIEGLPFRAFEVQGFLFTEERDEAFGPLYRFVLTPEVFEWYDYQKMNRFQKWYARNPEPLRDIMIAIAFLLSLGLTALQILQALQIIPTP